MSFEPLLSTSWTLCHERVIFFGFRGVFVWILWHGLVHVHLYNTKDIQNHHALLPKSWFSVLFTFGIFLSDYSIEEKDGQGSNSLAKFFRSVAMIHPLRPGVPKNGRRRDWTT